MAALVQSCARKALPGHGHGVRMLLPCDVDAARTVGPRVDRDHRADRAGRDRHRRAGRRQPGPPQHHLDIPGKARKDLDLIGRTVRGRIEVHDGTPNQQTGNERRILPRLRRPGPGNRRTPDGVQRFPRFVAAVTVDAGEAHLVLGRPHPRGDPGLRVPRHTVAGAGVEPALRLPLRVERQDGTLIPVDRVAGQRPYYSGCDDTVCIRG